MTTAVPKTPHASSLSAALRPFVLLAAAAFVVGFLGYVALGQAAVAEAQASAAVAEPAASPASDDWNLPKHI